MSNPLLATRYHGREPAKPVLLASSLPAGGARYCYRCHRFRVRIGYRMMHSRTIIDIQLPDYSVRSDGDVPLLIAHRANAR